LKPEDQSNKMESDTRTSMQTSLMHFLAWHWDLLWELNDEAVLSWSTIYKLCSNIWHLSMKLVVRLCVSIGFWGSLQSAIGTLLKLQPRWRRLESASTQHFLYKSGCLSHLDRKNSYQDLWPYGWEIHDNWVLLWSNMLLEILIFGWWSMQFYLSQVLPLWSCWDCQ
jgi:hypothetical protein